MSHSRKFASAKILGTNLLVVMVDLDCHGTCPVEVLPQAPVENILVTGYGNLGARMGQAMESWGWNGTGYGILGPKYHLQVSSRNY